MNYVIQHCLYLSGPNKVLLKQMQSVHARCFEDPWKDFENIFSIPNTHGWLALENQAVVGFLLIRSSVDSADILTFCVLPDKRKQGVGKKLLHTLQKEMKNLYIKEVFLEVAVDNNSALSLYRKLGFEKVGQRNGYYISKATVKDAIIFKLI